MACWLMVDDLSAGDDEQQNTPGIGKRHDQKMAAGSGPDLTSTLPQDACSKLVPAVSLAVA